MVVFAKWHFYKHLNSLDEGHLLNANVRRSKAELSSAGVGLEQSRQGFTVFLFVLVRLIRRLRAYKTVVVALEF